jgi:hypothetical protein
MKIDFSSKFAVEVALKRAGLAFLAILRKALLRLDFGQVIELFRA